ncbi:hypothetical protein DQ241_13010 [Blastococcus sp. TF02A-30]|nr:hypothetical protein DQ241_13010 [Blastococcus sp. TF02A-30]
MAAEVPGWCRQCGRELQHGPRRQGRARQYCDDACRKAFSRASGLRAELMREVGLQPRQVERLLALYRVAARKHSV